MTSHIISRDPPNPDNVQREFGIFTGYLYDNKCTVIRILVGITMIILYALGLHYFVFSDTVQDDTGLLVTFSIIWPLALFAAIGILWLLSCLFYVLYENTCLRCWNDYRNYRTEELEKQRDVEIGQRRRRRRN